MAGTCPVCDEPFEYRQVETPDGETGGVGVPIDIDELCGADPETRWNRICPRAIPAEDGSGTPIRLEVYRHHWESTR